MTRSAEPKRTVRPGYNSPRPPSTTTGTALPLPATRDLLTPEQQQLLHEMEQLHGTAYVDKRWALIVAQASLVD
jgi:hypothetical protein